jgi:hypothetical protein
MGQADVNRFWHQQSRCKTSSPMQMFSKADVNVKIRCERILADVKNHFSCSDKGNVICWDSFLFKRPSHDIF